MRQKFWISALLVTSLLASASVQAQQSAGQSRSFSLGASLNELGRSLFGGTPIDRSQRSASRRPGNQPAWMSQSSREPAQPSPQASQSPRTAARPAATSPAPSRQATAPRRPASQPASRSTSQSTVSSSRRTAQPGFQSSAPRPPQSVMSERSSSVVESRSERNAASESDGVNVQPRTLQDALRQARRTAPRSAPAATESYSTSAPAPSRNSGNAFSSRRAPPDDSPQEEITPEEPAVADEPIVTADAGRLPVIADAPPAAETRSTTKLATLSLETSGPQRVAIDTEARYEITLINSGDGVARDVALALQMPEWAEVIDATATSGDAQLPNWNETNGGVTWTLREVAPNSRETLVLQIVPRKSHSFDIGIQWTQAPGSAQMHVEVQEPKLIMTLAGPKEVEFGEKAIYKLTFSNPGNADAENVMVKLLPLGAGDAPADTHSIGVIRAGENKVVEMELVARQAGVLAIKAEATADGGLQAALNEDVLVRRAAIKIDVEAPNFQYARTVVNYAVRVTNPGTATAENVEVVAQLPAKATYVSSSDAGQAEQDDTRVVWNVRSLKPGEEKVLELKCQLENAGINRLQVAAAAGEMKDTASAATEVEALADLELDVVEPVGAFPVGDEVGYEIHIKNRGTKSAEGIDVQAFFSQGIEAVNATGAPNAIAPGKVTFETIGNIPAGKEVVLKIRATAGDAGNHVFRAEVSCKSTGAKLGAEGTTRFYGDPNAKPADRPAAAATPAASEPAPAASESTSSRRGRYDSSSTSGPGRYGDSLSAGSRYSRTPPSAFPADATGDDSEPLKPIPANEEASDQTTE